MVTLTAAQRSVVEHDGGAVRLRGGYGTGKTTALLHRFLRLAAGGGAGRTLVLCRTRAVADRFRDAALPHLAGGFDALPITTVTGLAFDAVRRAGDEVRLLTVTEQWATVRALLDDEQGSGAAPALWPRHHELLSRRAFVDEVARAVLHLPGGEPPEPLRGRWPEVAAFASRYRAHLAGRGWVDLPGLLARAAATPALPAFDHVLLDEVAADAAITPLLERVRAGAASVVAAVGPGEPDPAVPLPGAADVHLEGSFRTPRHDGLVLCHHPAVEPEAVAAELLAAHEAGVPWSGMAVLVRTPGRFARGLSRALARHGIDVAPVPGLPADEPVVREIVDVLRWVDGDDRARERVLASPLALDASEVHRLRDELAARAARDDPAEIAHAVFRRCLPGLVHDPTAGPGDLADDRALDAVVAFLDGLDDFAGRNPGARLRDYLAVLDGPDLEPDPWRAPAATTADAVTIASLPAAAGREWDTVVLAGCVDGEMPRVRGHVPYFDPELLAHADPPTVAERRRRSLDEETRLFALAVSRATGRLVATAAPEPGVLLSPFVGDWPRRAPALPPAPGRVGTSVPLTRTAGTGPMWPADGMRLSASQLETYEDCPLRYAYQYGLRVRDADSPSTTIGTIVHEVLAEACDPRGTEPLSESRVVELLDSKWHDGVARYRPQVEQARRDADEMLALWWEHEGRAIAEGTVEVLAVEHGFEVEVGPHVVRGSIDRIDRIDGGGIRIVDLKTGASMLRDDDMPDNVQLATYHLAAVRDPRIAAWGPPERLELVYLRKMETRAQPIPPDHEAATEARILAVAAAIQTESYEPSVDADCRYCPFTRLCPLWDEGREVGTA